MVGNLVPLRRLFPTRRFESNLDRLFDQFISPDWSWDWEAPEVFAPRANVAETPDAFEISVDLPGMKADDVHVELRDGSLWITGEKKEEKEEKGKTFHRMERYFGRFQKAIPLAAAVDESKITAEYKDGVLKMIAPKAESVKPKQITVKS